MHAHVMYVHACVTACVSLCEGQSGLWCLDHVRVCVCVCMCGWVEGTPHVMTLPWMPLDATNAFGHDNTQINLHCTAIKNANQP